MLKQSIHFKWIGEDLESKCSCWRWSENIKTYIILKFERQENNKTAKIKGMYLDMQPQPIFLQQIAT